MQRFRFLAVGLASVALAHQGCTTEASPVPASPIGAGGSGGDAANGGFGGADATGGSGGGEGGNGNETTLRRPTYVHRPAAAARSGTATVAQLGKLVSFRFDDGGEVVEYTIDLGHDDVLRGLLRIGETSSNSYPVAEGGLVWRLSGGGVVSPRELATMASTTLVDGHLDQANGTLSLVYDETFEGRVARKRYEFALEGSALRLHLTADAKVNEAYLGNYGGVRLGPTREVPNAKAFLIPFAESVPVVRFDGGFSTSTLFDWYRSSAADVVVYGSGDGVVSNTSFELSFSPVTVADEKGRALRPIDETAYVVVSRRITDHFPLPATNPSPYRPALASRSFVNMPSSEAYAWGAYRTWMSRLDACGVDSLAGMVFGWEPYGHNLLDPDRSHANPLGCDPTKVTTQGIDASTGLTVVDPTDPANVALVDAEFGPLMHDLADRGNLFGLYQDAGHHDQAGHGPYVGGSPYPSKPLHKPGWSYSAQGGTEVSFGLLVPQKNTFYDASIVVLDALGSPRGGWNTTANLLGSSWDGAGYPLHVVSPAHRGAYYTAPLTKLKDSYAPRAVYIDAVADLPTDFLIDRQSTSQRSHSIGEAIAHQRVALEQAKHALGGPLLGEPSYFRPRSWFGYLPGLWDGVSRNPAARTSHVDGEPLTVGDAIAKVPDYELTHVLPRASGHHGMGWENRWAPDAPLPLDGADGRTTSFLDGWWTAEVAFGHAPYVGTNGWRPNEYRSVEGVLREVHLVGPVHEAIVASAVSFVRYVDGTGQERNLDAALAANLDLVHPRLRIRYASGLEVMTNFGASDWTVTVPDVVPFDLALPVNGFVVADGKGLLVFSAKKPSSAQRIDYAEVPGHFRMLCSRGQATTFRGFPDAETEAALGLAFLDVANGTIIRNTVRGVAVGSLGGYGKLASSALESGRLEVATVGSPAMLVSLSSALSHPRAEVGVDVGVSARASLEGGGTRDLTTRVTWVSSNPEIASVDRNGGVRTVAPGVATLVASFDPDGEGGVPALVSPPQTLTVVP